MAKFSSIDQVPDSLKGRIGQYFSNVGGSTFIIHNLPPELTGGLLARYSRSPTGIQLTLINEFLDLEGNPSQQKGTELMDRVLNAFGDDSVGELEVTHVGIEDISQIGTKFIEDRRIGGSPIEQSTRYVKYDTRDTEGRWRYLRPEEIKEIGLLQQFELVNDLAFKVYSEGISRLSEYFKGQLPRDKFKITLTREGQKIQASERDLQTPEEKREFNNAYNFTIRCAALDVGRCVLPSSTLTHLGIQANGRFFSNLLTYMKSSELVEARKRASDLEEELKKVIPTFIKRNRHDPKKAEINKNMLEIATELFRGIIPTTDRVTLVEDAPLIDSTTAYSLFPYTNVSLAQITEVMRQLPLDKKREILKAYRGNRETRRDRTGRGLEAGYPLTFDLVGGFAEYRDLERHRMLTQQRQNLTTELGFILPPEMVEIGLEKEVKNVVNLMDDLNYKIKRAGKIEAAQYATLFNHRMRFALGMNLREFQHLSELRTQPAGHFSYRSMVMEMANKVKEKYPWIADHCQFVDYSDPNNKIARAKEQSQIAGRNVSRGIDGSLDF